MSQQQQQQQTAEDAASLKRQLAKGNENLNKKTLYSIRFCIKQNSSN